MWGVTVIDILDLVRARPWLREVLSSLHETVRSPWAMLLICFKDDPKRLPGKAHYERLFTSKGAGSFNMPRYFRDMSHGKLDLDDSEVFGWLRLDVPRSTFVGNVKPQPAGKLNRRGILDAARAKAAADGIDLAGFAGTVVCGYGALDLCGFLGGMAVLCDTSIQPSLLGHEMGHGYGLSHARRSDSDADYQDPWDVMSTAGWPGEVAPDAEYGSVGPGLNAASMRARGWLDGSRVAVAGMGRTTTVDLRPLHRRELSGFLAMEAGSFLVEFRVPEAWDAAIDAPRVLVHRMEGRYSTLMLGTKGQWSLGAGDEFQEDWTAIGGPGVVVRVDAIDGPGRKATVTVSVLVPERPPALVGGPMLGGIGVDGGGWVVVGGTVVKVPPRGPARDLLGSLVDYLAVPETGDVLATSTLRSSLAQAIVRHGIRLADGIEFDTEPPPGYAMLRERSSDEEAARPLNSAPRGHAQRRTRAVSG